MKRIMAIVALVALSFTYTWAAEEDKAKVLERVDAASRVLNEIMATPDKGIPQEILAGADCVIVVPSMLKGGFIFGARYGKGFATCRTAQHGANAWSAPAPIRIEGGSWGAQIGGQAIDLVMLAMNQQGVQHLLQSKFQVGADASAAAGPVGRHAEAGTDWKMRSELLTYSRSRGAFIGITLNGAVVKQDLDDTAALYGKDVTFPRILSGKVPPPSGTQKFTAEVHRYFGEAKVAAKERDARNRETDREINREENANTAAQTHSTSGMSGTSSAPAQNSNTGSGTTGSVAGSTQAATQSTGTTTETTQQNATQTGSMSGATDDQVRTNIENALHNTPNLSASNVAVDVKGNQVVLSGSVPNQSDKATIHRLAQQNSGGREVVDTDLLVK